MVEYRAEFKTTIKEGPIEDFEFTFPIASDETFEKNISVIFQALQDTLGMGNLSVTIHEFVEWGLIKRAEPTDPCWRWFIDGFANAITFELLQKHISEEYANGFAAAYDVNEYKDFERQINLQYWTSMNFSIKTPLEYENKLTYARYVYSMSEAQRLIENHGIDFARRILDEICIKKSRKGSDLVHAIKKVIGEDIQQRLSRYQTFQTRKEGIDKYTSLLNAALDKEDYEQMVINTMRLLELQDNPLSPTSLQMRQKAALWLFKLGHEKAADEAMLSFMEELKRNAPQQLYDYFSAGFIVYALQCNKPQKAQSAAEHFLKNHPDHPPALTVRMQLLTDKGELAEARKIAHRICELTEDDSLYHKAAREVLAKEPKQQQDKQPIP